MPVLKFPRYWGDLQISPESQIKFVQIGIHFPRQLLGRFLISPEELLDIMRKNEIYEATEIFMNLDDWVSEHIEGY